MLFSTIISKDTNPIENLCFASCPEMSSSYTNLLKPFKHIISMEKTNQNYMQLRFIEHAIKSLDSYSKLPFKTRHIIVPYVYHKLIWKHSMDMNLIVFVQV